MWNRLLASALLNVLLLSAAPLPRIQVSRDGRFLMDEQGKPFFYFADTAWELFHRLTREEAIRYLDTRARQGFNAVQAVALAELDGLTVPNAYGKLPLVDKDPARPAVTPGSDARNPPQYDYWDHVDYIVDQANQRGIYVALLPTWGAWVTNVNKKDDPVFTTANAQAYGEFLGRRYGKKGILWVLGGDRTATGFLEVWRAMAKGIAIGVSGREDYSGLLMSFHPRGGETSSTTFHNDPWLDFNMQQTGHGLAQAVQSWNKISADYARTPVKPVIDGEPLYEDHPLAFRAKDNGYSFDAHIRQRAYWDVFSGSCGHTYGNHAVWQMYAPARQPVNGPLMYWTDAIHRPGPAQLSYLKKLMESRPYFSRVPDQSLLVDAMDGVEHLVATRGDGYAFVYSPMGRRFSLQMGKISGEQIQPYWFNPRSGTSQALPKIENGGTKEFVPPSEGFGSDWVLVLDDPAKRFPAP